MDFTSDHRKRLTREVRDQDGQVVYDISYTYDPLGNRKTRMDEIAQQRVAYTYDTDYENPLDLDYPTRHNRLVQYVVRAGVDPNAPVVRTVKYTYWLTGNASNITVKDEYYAGGAGVPPAPGDSNDYDRYHDLALYYFTNGQLWRAQWGKWKNLPENSRPEPATCQPLGVREFRYDDPRGRYLAVDYDAGLMDPNHPGGTLDLQWPLNWTDYLGATPLGDAQVDYDAGPPATWPVTATTDYLLALYGQQETATGDTTYYHGDLIGSMSLLTHRDGQGGQPAAPATTAYIAFGETVTLTSSPDPNDPNAVIWSAAIGGDLPAGFPRYGYAGQYGYESGLLSAHGPNTNLSSITLQHLGWRWHDPSIGRFVRRDPNGLRDDSLVYAYLQAQPSILADPYGLGPDEWGFIDIVARRGDALLDRLIRGDFGSGVGSSCTALYATNYKWIGLGGFINKAVTVHPFAVFVSGSGGSVPVCR